MHLFCILIALDINIKYLGYFSARSVDLVVRWECGKVRCFYIDQRYYVLILGSCRNTPYSVEQSPS